MPQIAQQDYIVIKPKEGRAANVDAECLRRLKLACENGTIFDCLVKDITIAEDNSLGRVLGKGLNNNSADIYDTGNAEPYTLELPYTVEQYSGLAAVQEAEDEYLETAASDMPSLGNSDGFLSEFIEGLSICVNDFKLFVTVSGGILTALEISDTKPDESDDFINIAWEDALKLIGLPIS